MADKDKGKGTDGPGGETRGGPRPSPSSPPTGGRGPAPTPPSPTTGGRGPAPTPPSPTTGGRGPAPTPPSPPTGGRGPAPTPPSPTTDWRTFALHLGSKVVEFGSVLHLVRGHKEQFTGFVEVSQAALKTMANFRQRPGLFRDIGQDAKGLLLLDFMADNLMMDENTKPSCNLMCGAGLTSSSDCPVRKLFVRAKHANTTVDVNATTNANAITKFAFDGIFGPQTKGILSVPLPNGRSKFEFQALRPSSGLTAAFGTTMDSPLEVSCMIGSKLFSLGGSFEATYDTTSQSFVFGHCIGLAAKFPKTSVSFIMDHNRTVTATAVRYISPWRTSFGLLAKHQLIDPNNHQVSPELLGAFEDAAVVLGARFLLGESLSLKVRASSNLFASAVVRASIRRRLTIALSGEVNLRNIRQGSKVGAVLSFP